MARPRLSSPVKLRETGEGDQTQSGGGGEPQARSGRLPPPPPFRRSPSPAGGGGQEEPSRFHLDRHITLALILALALQAGGVLVWVGRTAARIEEMEQRLDRQGPIAERLARLEEQAAAARASLDRIELKLDRLEGRRGR